MQLKGLVESDLLAENCHSQPQSSQLPKQHWAQALTLHLKYFSTQHFLQILFWLLRHQPSAPAANSKRSKQPSFNIATQHCQGTKSTCTQYFQAPTVGAGPYPAVTCSKQQARCSQLNKTLLYTRASMGPRHPSSALFTHLMLILPSL